MLNTCYGAYVLLDVFLVKGCFSQMVREGQVKRIQASSELFSADVLLYQIRSHTTEVKVNFKAS